MVSNKAILFLLHCISFIAFGTTFELRSLFLVSNDTPDDLLELLHGFPEEAKKIGQVTAIQVSNNCEDLSTLIQESTDETVAFNLLFNMELEYCACRISETLGKVLISPLRTDYDILQGRNSWCLSTNQAIENEAKAMSKVIEYFGWEKSLVIASPDLQSIELSKRLAWEPLDFLSTASGLAQEVYEMFIARAFKTLGTRVATFVSNGEVTEHCLRAAQVKHVAKEGYGFLLSQASGWFTLGDEQLFQNGLLIITELGFEKVSSAAEFAFASIMRVLQQIHASGVTHFSPESIKNVLMTYILKPQQANPSLSIVNVQNHERKVVGRYYDEQVHITDAILFPGSTVAAPPQSKVSVPFTATSTKDFVIPAPMGTLGLLGIGLALQHVNDGQTYPNVFPNHLMAVNYLDLGQIVPVKGLITANFAQAVAENRLGVAHITAMTSGVTMVQMIVQNELGIQVSNVGTINTASSLSNPAAWPNYHRIAVSDLQPANVITRWIQSIGWNHLAILHDSQVYDIEYATVVVEQAQKRRIEILNDEHLIQELPDGEETADEMEERVMPWVQEIWESNVRAICLFFLNLEYTYAILRAFESLGASPGDLYVFINAGLEKMEIDGSSTDKAESEFKLMIGSISIYQDTLVGEFGDWFLQEFNAVYSDDQYDSLSCYFYDATFLIASASSMLLSVGQEFESAAVMRHGIQETKFTGCTGVINFPKDSNDRDIANFSIKNLQTVDGVYSIKLVGIFSPLLASQFQYFDGGIVFSDGSNNPPIGLRVNNYDCPFDESKSEMFDAGITLTYIISFALLTLTCVITAYLWRKYWNV